jgi:4-hydroxy-tetrahydrodipicolinate synthase
MVLDQTIKGVYAIAATPFHVNGAVDWDSVDRLTDIMLNAAQPG